MRANANLFPPFSFLIEAGDESTVSKNVVPVFKLFYYKSNALDCLGREML